MKRFKNKAYTASTSEEPLQYGQKMFFNTTV
jgi:hypothetical protein